MNEYPIIIHIIYLLLMPNTCAWEINISGIRNKSENSGLHLYRAKYLRKLHDIKRNVISEMCKIILIGNLKDTLAVMKDNG